MGFLSNRKNKRFNYTPRFYKGEGSPYEMKHKFDEYRSTIDPGKGIKGKFVNAINDFKSNPDQATNKRVLIIVLILIAICLLILEFDLSIFYS